MLLPLFFVLGALAQEPAVAPTTEPAAAAPPAENPCTDGVERAIEGVRLRGSKAAYLCLAGLDEAGPDLLRSALVGGANQERITRALALHMIVRLDGPMNLDALRALGAADRRLLRDAVYARRGRASPSVEQAEVFAQFDWYKPNPKYTDGLLTEQDRTNLGLIDNPPPPPPPETAADAVASAGEGTEGAEKPSSWPLAVSVGGGVGVAAALAARRRRQQRLAEKPAEKPEDKA